MEATTSVPGVEGSWPGDGSLWVGTRPSSEVEGKQGRVPERTTSPDGDRAASRGRGLGRRTQTVDPAPELRGLVSVLECRPGPRRVPTDPTRPDARASSESPVPNPLSTGHFWKGPGVGTPATPSTGGQGRNFEGR